jgi:hypothetical protein
MDLDRSEFQSTGALLIKRALSPEQITELERASHANNALRVGNRITRPSDALLAALMAPGGATDLASHLEGETLRPVRILLFDKTAQTNWAVAWHQDRVLPIREEWVCDGFERWTRKNGIPHVEPPEWLSSRMVTLRLHLDDCGPENAPLRILPGTHRSGRLTDAGVADAVRRIEVTDLPCEAGDILAVKSLTVHASKKAASPTRRRVLHVDFAPDDLPAGLSWSFDLTESISR